tara:strand:- start:636 stop:3200 length:2565 start_codon:yes stop_codon:yes gene_type:complete
MAQSKQAIAIDGHTLTVSNLDKVLYPSTGTTKADVLEYYDTMADLIIAHAHAHGRPATRKRWVDGVGTAEKPGKVFFQKNLEDFAPEWIARGTIEHKDHSNVYPLVNDRATLAWLGQVAALEIHVPQWQFGKNGQAKNPDRLVLDLDPGDGVGLAECAEVARYARTILKDMDLDPVPVTSGSKGIHLYAALDGRSNSRQVSEVAHELARALEADHPDLVVSDMKRSLRSGKVLVDWSQNSSSKTTVTPYSLRGRLRPTVATPRTWRELADPELAQLEYRDVMKRMKRRKDPMAALAAATASPGGTGSAATAADDAAADDDDAEPADAETVSRVRDRLELYRSKRDSAKTPEPIPESTPSASDARSFVIQEHHARQLHYDFRLEHDGVLVSWAVPKGVPTTTTKNHLAVQTEDHPLEYGSFEGSIPSGEYGAGEVSIWDAGTYELEKWRDGEEIIVTLHGRADGGLGKPTKVALIHTRGTGKSDSNWLIHRMKAPTNAPSRETASHERTVTPEKRTRATTSRTASAGSNKRSARISPMLATLGNASDLSEDDDWAFEMKWDGIRVVASLGTDADDIALHTRNGNDVTVSYPEIVEALRASVGEGACVLDGEIVALNRQSRPDFGLLQQRMGVTAPADVERARKKTPVQYLVFDLLSRDGTNITDESYRERRRQLRQLVVDKGTIHVPDSFDGNLEAAIRSSSELKLEGVVAKKSDSTYAVGRRSRAWIKIKHHLTQEVVVGGWRPGKGRRAGGVGSLLLGIPSGDKLQYVGRVGTGFTDKQLDEIGARLESRQRKTSPLVDVPRADSADAHWVTPSLVGEVEFAEWTSDGRLRQASWRGWRPDKTVEQVTVETDG